MLEAEIAKRGQNRWEKQSSDLFLQIWFLICRLCGNVNKTCCLLILVCDVLVSRFIWFGEGWILCMRFILLPWPMSRLLLEVTDLQGFCFNLLFSSATRRCFRFVKEMSQSSLHLWNGPSSFGFVWLQMQVCCTYSSDALNTCKHRNALCLSQTSQCSQLHKSTCLPKILLKSACKNNSREPRSFYGWLSLRIQFICNNFISGMIEGFTLLSEILIDAPQVPGEVFHSHFVIV